MRVFKRHKGPGTLNQTDYVTVGLASEIMGCDRTTVRKLIRAGDIPGKRADIRSHDMLVNVGHVVHYCVMNNMYFNPSSINTTDLLSMHKYAIGALVHAVDESLIESKMPDGFTKVNLNQLFKFVEVDPYKTIVLGLAYGLQYAIQVMNEIQATFKVDIHGMQMFRPNIVFCVREAFDIRVYDKLSELAKVHYNLVDIHQSQKR